MEEIDAYRRDEERKEETKERRVEEREREKAAWYIFPLKVGEALLDTF
jgi:hypothetical protein